MKVRFRVEGSSAVEIEEKARATAAALAGDLPWRVKGIRVSQSDVVDRTGQLPPWCAEVRAWVGGEP